MLAHVAAKTPKNANAIAIGGIIPALTVFFFGSNWPARARVGFDCVDSVRDISDSI